MRDRNGVSYARKAMVRTTMSLNVNGLWKEGQLTDDLQQIIAKHRVYFEGEPVLGTVRVLKRSPRANSVSSSCFKPGVSMHPPRRSGRGSGARWQRRETGGAGGEGGWRATSETSELGSRCARGGRGGGGSGPRQKDVCGAAHADEPMVKYHIQN